MLRFIILVIIAIAIFWGYNNFDFSQFVDNSKSAIQNEKTIKAVNDKRAFDYESEQNAGKNEN